MSSCLHCKSKNWNCLGRKVVDFVSTDPKGPNPSCKRSITIDEARTSFSDVKSVAMFCNCCDHNFVCRSCYDLHPSYDYWKPIFGNNHAVKNIVTGESSATRFMVAFNRGEIDKDKTIYSPTNY